MLDASGSYAISDAVKLRHVDLSVAKEIGVVARYLAMKGMRGLTSNA